MIQKELLRERIEEERRKLDGLVENGAGMEETYLQSLVLDKLIEQYMGL